MNARSLALIVTACGAGTAGLYLASREPTRPLASPQPLGDLLTLAGDTRVDVTSLRENDVWRYRYSVKNRCRADSGLRIRSWFVSVDSPAAPDIRSPRGWECRAEPGRDTLWKVSCRALASEQEVPPGDTRAGFEITLSRESALRHGFGIRFHDGQGFESGTP